MKKNNLNDLIFDYFPPIPNKQWKQKIQYELNGEDYQKKLVRHTVDNVSTLPYYTYNDVSFFYDYKKKESQSCHIIHVNNEAEANLLAQSSTSSFIIFNLYSKEVLLDQLFDNLNTNKLLVHCFFLNLEFFNKIKNHNIPYTFNPINKLFKTGTWYRNEKWDFEQLFNSNCNNGIIDVSIFHNSGASPLQQIAYAISHAQELIKLNTKTNINLIFYLVSVNTNVFEEIAKLRTIKILHSYFFNNIDCQIILTKSKRNFINFDEALNQNIFNTEKLIAASAHVDFIENYQKRAEQSNMCSEAIYTEKLLQQYIDLSIPLIKNMNQKGILELFKSGIIQQKIKDHAYAELKKFESTFEKNFSKFKTPINSVKLEKPSKEVQFEPLVERRLSENLEKKYFDA